MTLEPLLRARDLVKHFPVAGTAGLLVPAKKFTAVDSVSFDLYAGRTLALVGGSGSGTEGFACLFIAHDLAVVRQIATSVAVMTDGKVVEAGDRDEVFDARQRNARERETAR